MDTQYSTSPEQLPTVETLERLLDEPIEVKLHLLRHYAEMARLMEEEVETLAGERYSRDKPHEGRYRRWGQNPGSICVDGECVPVDESSRSSRRAGRGDSVGILAGRRLRAGG